MSTRHQDKLCQLIWQNESDCEEKGFTYDLLLYRNAQYMYYTDDLLLKSCTENRLIPSTPLQPIQSCYPAERTSRVKEFPTCPNDVRYLS
jgi:hypothetical protein